MKILEMYTISFKNIYNLHPKLKLKNNFVIIMIVIFNYFLFDSYNNEKEVIQSFILLIKERRSCY